MTTPPFLAPNLVLLCDMEALRAELCKARNAQQTAEIALANEREANVIEGVRVAINDAIRSQREAFSERDRVQRDCKQAQAFLEKAQRAIQHLEDELTRLFLENRLLERENEELTAVKPSARYSPLVENPTRYCRHRYHIPATHYRRHTPAAESPCSTTHPSSPSPFGPPTGLPDEETVPAPVYDRTVFTPWTYAPPSYAMERSTAV